MIVDGGAQILGGLPEVVSGVPEQAEGGALFEAVGRRVSGHEVGLLGAWPADGSKTHLSNGRENPALEAMNPVGG